MVTLLLVDEGGDACLLGREIPRADAEALYRKQSDSAFERA